jgi:hypothetical protein
MKRRSRKPGVRVQAGLSTVKESKSSPVESGKSSPQIATPRIVKLTTRPLQKRKPMQKRAIPRFVGYLRRG